MRIRFYALGAVACFVVLALSACSNGTNAALPSNVGLGPDVSTASRASAGLSIGHVYFAKSSALIAEYPIVHGIAATSPDRTLHLPSVSSGYERWIMDIAVDPNGNLAVLTEISTTTTPWQYTNALLFYAPSSRGRDVPSRVLNLPGGAANAFSVAFDPKGNAYIGMSDASDNWGYGVYSSGASGSGAPRATFPLAIGAAPIAFAGSMLYVGSEENQITAYANAATHPVAVNAWCLRPYGGWTSGNQVGIDSGSKRLFVPEWLESSHKDTSRIAIYPLNKSACPQAPIDGLSEHVSPTPNGRFDPSAVWYNDNYIYVADDANGVTYEVPAKPGAHAPVVTLPGIGAMAFGP